MWDCIKNIAALITILLALRKFIKGFDFSNVLFSLSILWYYFKLMVNHPLYNKIGIGINALQLFVSCMYAAFGFALLIKKGYSIEYASIPLIIMFAVSINLFYQSTKLYQK